MTFDYIFGVRTGINPVPTLGDINTVIDNFSTRN